MQLAVAALSSYFNLIGFTVLEIERFSYFDILAWNCPLTPTFRGFVGIFSQVTSSIVVTPKRHLLVVAQKHVVLAIKRENQSNGSTSAQDREKRTGQDSQKITKVLYFTYLGISPHWTDFEQNLYSSCRPRDNHVCKFLNWHFLGLRLDSGSNFPFSCWFLCGPYNSAALMRCLWFSVPDKIIPQWLPVCARSS